MLTYLLNHREYLEAADQLAPNRLLFNGLAFYTLGKILNHDQAVKVASSFINAAVQQVHQEGYFIESGGFDSSYNGVATALGLRLLLMGYDKDNLDTVSRKAILWQKSRISETGEILTTGNSRVKPSGGGESFLGRTKDVDAGHTVEAFMLASQFFSDQESVELASNVLTHYREQSQKQ